MLAVPAFAGGVAEPRVEPEVIAAQCPLYGILGLRWRSCSTGSDWTPRERKEDSTSTSTSTTTVTEHESEECTVEGEEKSDNSDANGRGGNDHDRADKESDAQETAEDKKA